MSRAAALPLAEVRVLITRPVGQSRSLARRVRALGGVPVALPGVSLRVEAETTRADLRAALDADLVLFTSPAAVRYAARLGPLRGRARIACVGAGTARVLARHGVADPLMPLTTSDSAGLLAHPELAVVRGRTVMLVGAPGGRGKLQRTLRSRGARVCELHVYRRVPARLDRRHREALRHLGTQACILLSSVETLRCLQAALDETDRQRLHAVPVVASSRRVAAAAHRAGFARVEVAGSALGATLLAQASELQASGQCRVVAVGRQTGIA